MRSLISLENILLGIRSLFIPLHDCLFYLSKVLAFSVPQALVNLTLHFSIRKSLVGSSNIFYPYTPLIIEPYRARNRSITSHVFLSVDRSATPARFQHISRRDNSALSFSPLLNLET